MTSFTLLTHFTILTRLIRITVCIYISGSIGNFMARYRTKEVKLGVTPNPRKNEMVLEGPEAICRF